MRREGVAARMLGRAHGDARVMEAAANLPDSDDWAIGFHAQQALEKALEAVLLSRDLDVPRDVRELARRVTAAGLELPVDVNSLAALTPWAAAGRYPELPEDDAVDRAHLAQIVLTTLDWAAPLVAKDA